MYAIVDIAGQQFRVEKDQEIFVHRLKGEEGSKVDFDGVLLIDNNGKVTVGTPVVEGATVSAKIISHLKGDKVLVFKKKRRKGYKKLNGHRQYLSKIVIEAISEKGGKAKAKKEEPKAEVKEVKKAEPKTEPKVAVKTEAKPKAEVKKETKPKVVAKPKVEVKETKIEAKPKAAAKPKTAAKPKAEPKAEVKKETKPKAAAKPKTVAKPKAEAKKETKEDKE